LGHGGVVVPQGFFSVSFASHNIKKTPERIGGMR